MKLLRRLQYLLNRSRHQRELAEEMEFHRSMMEDPRQMGNTTLAREDARHVWLAPWIESVFQDLRYAFRSLRAQPGFTAMALLALVLGIGLNTSLFTLFNAATNQLWPVPEADRMMIVRVHNPSLQIYSGLPVVAYRHLAANSKSIAGAILERPYPVMLDDQPRSAHFVSGNYFEVLGGREMDVSFPAEDALAVVLSHRIWVTQYGSDPGILGKQLRIDDVPFTVTGVAPEWFTGTSMESHDLWVPIGALPMARPNDPSVRALLTSAGWCCTSVAVRLAPGVSREQAKAEIAGLYSQFMTESGEEPGTLDLNGTAMLDDPDDRSSAMPVAMMLFAAVGSILLLACANVSNLQLARAAARQREIAIRVAIGAGRWRVIRQLLTECLLLAGVASAAGLALAYFVPELVAGAQMGNLRLTPDLNVLGYTIVTAAGCAILFGLAPALRSTRISVGDAIKQQSTQMSARFPLRGVLLGVQVAISVALLVCAGLLARGLAKARSTDLGFRTQGVAMVRVQLPRNSYDPTRTQTFFDDLTAQLSEMGNGPVGLSALEPLGNGHSTTNFNLPSDPPELRRDASVQYVNPGYSQALDIPIVRGRNLLAEDRKNGGILVNETLAKRFWPNDDALGKKVNAGGQQASTVVGIVRDSKVYGMGAVPPTYFTPFGENTHFGAPALIVPTNLVSAADATVRRMEPRASTTIVSFDQQIDRALGDSRMAANAAAGLGALALLLATIGVYGVISYSVEQRRKEIGIRMALGARSTQVVSLVFRRNATAILCGLAAGLVLAAGASVVLESELHGLSRMDPIAYAAVFAILLAAGAAASVIPARRAARTDAASVLQEQ